MNFWIKVTNFCYKFNYSIKKKEIIFSIFYFQERKIEEVRKNKMSLQMTTSA